MQDVEFTVQEGKLFMLQTRSGKRTAEAALKAAVDMVGEGLIDKHDGRSRASSRRRWTSCCIPRSIPTRRKEQIAIGLGASPGAATGEVVFTAEEAEKLAADHHDVILVRTETSPEDIHGMHAARGILTARGGMTSHAAVVARGMGRPCVSGAGMLKIDVARGEMTAGDCHHQARRHHHHRRHDRAGVQGPVAMRQPELTGDFGTLMGWADEVRRLKVRTNADTPADAATARKLRRRRHRPVPHRTHVLRGRPHPRGAPDDPGRRRRRSAKRRWPSCCRCSAAISKASSR